MDLGEVRPGGASTFDGPGSVGAGAESGYSNVAPNGLESTDMFRDEDAFQWLFLTSDLAPLDQAVVLEDEMKEDDLFPLVQYATATPSLVPAQPPTLSGEQHSLDLSAAVVATASSIAPPKPPMIKRESTVSSSRDSVASFDDSDSDDSQSDESDRSSLTASTTDASKKKRKRLKRNRDSARESRKRRLARIQENELRLKKLEIENTDLKMRLKIGKEAILVERQEKATYKQKMQHLLQTGASEAEVAKFIEQYKTNYSDYGAKRQETISFHIARVRELLLPTQVTKMCLYSVENGDEVPMKPSMATQHAPPPPSDSESSNLWEILAKELNISQAQQRQIFQRREQIKVLRENLNKNLRNLAAFEVATQEKNRSLNNEVAMLQTILTPQQATKFIIWVKENPAFMYMLDQLVQSIIAGTDDVEKQVTH
ncbi:hypothetical protein AeMF1_015828 [Aphanomyces euteiches]|nr:hypothetical protein AeMF1_015828 [Aphanomyces euteiches]KAH9195108.1 hypothetical protein AeNC1_002923 [Aphanomyces euteiches]